MKKRLLIDCTTLLEQIDGLTRYALNVIARLDTSRLDITLLARPDNASWLRTQLPFPILVAAIGPIGPKRDWAFCRWLGQHQQEYDLFFSPSNQFPAGVRIPSVFVDHDVIYEEFPSQLGRLSWLKRIYLHHVVRRGLRTAKKTICVSNYTKQDTCRYHGSRYADRMLVIGEGWEHLAGTERSVLPDRGKYLFYLGSSRGHKNVRNLLRAVSLLRQDMEQQGFRLIISGKIDHYEATDRQLLQQLSPVVQTTGWISDADMSLYLQGAEALVFPSLSEGFGIPLLEAFYYGVPVACSQRASLPEVAADAALYFNPTCVEDLADKLRQIIQGNYPRQELIDRGRQRLQVYSWQQAADQISNVLLSIA